MNNSYNELDDFLDVPPEQRIYPMKEENPWVAAAFLGILLVAIVFILL